MVKKQQNLRVRRLTAVFDGRVQGVGFRFTTVEVARNHPVTGYVLNMMDGSVKLVAEGPEDELHRFLDDIREAHIFRYVTREDIHWQDATGEFTSFVIRYS
jgi:acylphosphatase